VDTLIGHLAVDTCCRLAQEFQDSFTNQGAILLMRLRLLDYFKKLDDRSFAQPFTPQFSVCFLNFAKPKSGASDNNKLTWLEHATL